MKGTEGPRALMPLSTWRGRHHHARSWPQQGSDDLARSEARLTGWGDEGMGGGERQPRKATLPRHSTVKQSPDIEWGGLGCAVYRNVSV